MGAEGQQRQQLLHVPERQQHRGGRDPRRSAVRASTSRSAWATATRCACSLRGAVADRLLHLRRRTPRPARATAAAPTATGALVLTAAATKGAANSCSLPAGAAQHQGQRGRVGPERPGRADQHRRDPGRPLRLPAQGQRRHPRLHDRGGHDRWPPTASSWSTSTRPSAWARATPSGSTPRTARTCSTPRRTRPTRTRPPGAAAPTAPAPSAVTATLGAANACGPAGPPEVAINEVESNGDQVADWVELKNLGTAAGQRLRLEDRRRRRLARRDPRRRPGRHHHPGRRPLRHLHRDRPEPRASASAWATRSTSSCPTAPPRSTPRPGARTPATTCGRCPDGTGDVQRRPPPRPAAWPTPAARSGSTRSSPTAAARATGSS